MNEFKEVAKELWEAIRVTAGCALCTIGCTIGLVGSVVSTVADGILEASRWIAGEKKGAFEKDDMDEDVIYE